MYENYIIFAETARRMREESEARRDGPAFGICLSAFDGCDAIVTS